ncbi:MAG: hypothetical protein V4608_15040 [Bacteroidota bacterium]
MTEIEKEKIILEIGYISVSFSYFDFLINQLNIILINSSYSKIGEILSNELQTYARIKLCKKLLNVFPLKEALVEKVLLNLDTFETMREKRNKFIHGILHTKSEDDLVSDDLYLLSLKDLLKDMPAVKVELAELTKIKTTLENLAKEQIELNEDINTNYSQIILDDIKQKEKMLDVFRNIDSV